MKMKKPGTLMELHPVHSRQKSFYGKAMVWTCNGTQVLYSYNTPVCWIRNGTFHRAWNGWSITTSRHCQEFRRQNGLQGLCKSVSP